MTAIRYAAIAAVLIAAALLRQPGLWTPHADPVEVAYAALAMKLGTRPSLDGYHMGGIQIRRETAPQKSESGSAIPLLIPVEATPTHDSSFAAWPKDSNPFFYKPPLFPSLLTYSHHRAFDPQFNAYPLLAAAGEGGIGTLPSKAVAEAQGWAARAPAISGWLVVLLTLALGWALFTPAAGIVGAALVAAHPASILVSVKIWPEATLTTCLLAAAFLFYRFTSSRNWAGCLLAGLAFGLAIQTDLSALFLLPAFWIWSAAPRSNRPWIQRLAFNPYALAFAAGAVWIAKSWFDHTGHTFGDAAWRHAVTTPLSGKNLPEAAWDCFAASPLLIAAVFSLMTFWPGKKSPLPSADASVRTLGLLVVSWVAVRWAFNPQAAWDERALAPAIPFLALLAAQALCGFFEKLRTRFAGSR